MNNVKDTYIAIIASWFTVEVLVPWLLLTVFIVWNTRAMEARTEDCISVIYDQSIDPYTKKTVLTRKSPHQKVLTWPIEYYKANSPHSVFTYRASISMSYFSTENSKVVLDITTAQTSVIDIASIKVIKFKLSGSEDEISLEVSRELIKGSEHPHSPQYQYYIDLSKGTSNYKALESVPDRWNDKIGGSSVVLIKDGASEMVTADSSECNWFCTIPPAIPRLKELTYCVNNPPNISKDFVVFEE